MKVLTGLKFAAMLAVVSAAVALTADTPKALAQAEAPQQSEAQNQQQEEVTGVYSYVAQPGDSYSLIARKAVQTYGLTFDVNLSQAAIIFAETHLTQDAGSPLLTVGQEVTVNEAVVKKWVDQAQSLTGAQEEAWGYYAQFADFNTNAVGETRE